MRIKLFYVLKRTLYFTPLFQSCSIEILNYKQKKTCSDQITIEKLYEKSSIKCNCQFRYTVSFRKYK